MLILVSPGVTKLQVDPYFVLRSNPRVPVVFGANARISFNILHSFFLPEINVNGAHWTSKGQR